MNQTEPNLLCVGNASSLAEKWGTELENVLLLFDFADPVLDGLVRQRRQRVELESRVGIGAVADSGQHLQENSREGEADHHRFADARRSANQSRHAVETEIEADAACDEGS